METKKVHIKVVGPDYGDKNFYYDPAKPQSDEYQIARDEVMTKIEKSYRFLDRETGKPVPFDKDTPLPEAGEFVLLMPVSGG